jgi:hypothetical protein
MGLPSGDLLRPGVDMDLRFVLHVCTVVPGRTSKT